jgi:polyphosphate:AMP phosphotransferase
MDGRRAGNGGAVFETAELGRSLDKATFDTLGPKLRVELLELQQALRKAPFPVILVFAGVDAAGKGETVNLLNQWMDPRFIQTRAYARPSDEEQERPEMWRYWISLPSKGRFGMFQSSWYSRPVLDHVFGRIDDATFDQDLRRIAAFEKTLTDDKAVILKFWMHMGADAQKARYEALQADPLEAWRITPGTWQNWERYDEFVATAERCIRQTSTGLAPWFIIEGSDHRYRSVAVATIVRDAVKAALQAQDRRELARSKDADEPPELLPDEGPMLWKQPTVLDGLDMELSLKKKEYKLRLREAQGRLALLNREAKELGISSVLVFQGWDAAGKGGAIKRLADALQAKDVRMHAIAAPSDEERAQHYLWRFWRRLPRAGHIAIFDRSWYGRVLVERVEGFATDAEWQRAYSEINSFEEALVAHGTVLVKYWLHITPEEQLARFEHRAETPWKSWKLTDEDWRNRDKWSQYERAVHDMVERTSTHGAPWTLVEANDKHWARVKVIETYTDALEAAVQKAKARA